MTDALTGWLRTRAVPLSTLDPDGDDDTDLEPLLDVVGDARVVAVGESVHRAHELFWVRHRMFRFLVRRAGFTALVMESGFPEGLTVDAWARHGGPRRYSTRGSADARSLSRRGPGLREVLERGTTYRFGACQEMLDQLAWMREYNISADRPVRFFGADLPDSAACALPGVHATLDLLDDADPDYARHVRATVLPLFDYLPADRTGLAQAATAIHAYLALDGPTRAMLTAGLGDLAERVRARRLDYIAAVDDRERVDAAVRAAEVARAVDAFLAAMVAGPTRTWPPANIRDRTIADTVAWVAEREPRVLVAAANGHVQKVPYLAPPFVTQPMTTAGQHLADALGDDLVVVGSTYGGGTAWLHRPGPTDRPGHSSVFTDDLGTPDPDSLDAALARAATDHLAAGFLVDLRPATGDVAAALDATTGTHNGPHVQPADARRAFDALLYVPRLTPWHTWLDAQGLLVGGTQDDPDGQARGV